MGLAGLKKKNEQKNKGELENKLLIKTLKKNKKPKNLRLRGDYLVNACA